MAARRYGRIVFQGQQFVFDVVDQTYFQQRERFRYVALNFNGIEHGTFHDGRFLVTFFVERIGTERVIDRIDRDVARRMIPSLAERNFDRRRILADNFYNAIEIDVGFAVMSDEFHVFGTGRFEEQIVVVVVVPAVGIDRRSRFLHGGRKSRRCGGRFGGGCRWRCRRFLRWICRR